MQTVVNVILTALAVLVSLVFGYQVGHEKGILEGYRRLMFIQSVLSPDNFMAMDEKISQYTNQLKERAIKDE